MHSRALTTAVVATVLLWASVAAGVELGETLPGIREAPAPEWARPGVRLAYYSVMASTPASTHYYTPNEDGDWVSGTFQTDPLWIPPESLRVLRPGQVIDRDTTVGETVKVRAAGGGTVTVAATSQAVDIERVYDVGSGLLLSFQVAGGPSELAKSITQARLVRGP